MNLLRYLQILNRRKWIVIVTALAVLTVTIVGTLRTRPVYAATALVRVAQADPGSVSYTDLGYTDRLIQTYVMLVKSRPLLEGVVERLQLELTPWDLSTMVGAEAILNTELIRVGAESHDPALAAAIANTLANVLVEQGQTLYSGQGKSAREILLEQITIVEQRLQTDRELLAALAAQSAESEGTPGTALQDLSTRISAAESTYANLLAQYEAARLEEALRANSLTVVEEALTPTSPSRPKTMLNLVLGLVVGIAGGLGLGLVFENLDPVIHSRDDLEGITSLPVLGTIPRVRPRRGIRNDAFILRESAGWTAAGEAFRILGTKATALSAATGARTLLVTSPEPGAGKSTVVANLAGALAQAGNRVIVVDGDLRRPVMHSLMGVTREPGLSDVASSAAGLSAYLKDTRVPGVRALTAGAAPPNPLKLLSGLPASQLLERLADAADYVIWDSPPLLASADAGVLAPLADGVLLVVASEQATTKQVRMALRDLEQVGARTIGIIYNKAEADNMSYSYYGHRNPPSGDGR